MFSLREFIKRGLLDAVGKMSDYQVILNAAAWNEKGVLLEEDLVEIQSAIDAMRVEVTDEEQDADETSPLE